MSFWLIALAVIVWTLFAFWAGTKYGNALEQDALKELQSFRDKAAAKIKGNG